MWTTSAVMTITVQTEKRQSREWIMSSREPPPHWAPEPAAFLCLSSVGLWSKTGTSPHSSQWRQLVTHAVRHVTGPRCSVSNDWNIHQWILQWDDSVWSRINFELFSVQTIRDQIKENHSDLLILHIKHEALTFHNLEPKTQYSLYHQHY